MRSPAPTFALLFLTACFEPIDAPSEAERAVVNCDDDQAWAAQVEACRSAWADGEGCAGVVHFEGNVGQTPVRVAAEANSSRFVDALVDSPVSRVRTRVDVQGKGPSFGFLFVQSSLGGEVGGQAPALDVEAQSDELDDGLATFAVWLTDGRARQAFQAQSGTLTRSLQSDLEQAGEFEIEFGESQGGLRGCFHLFATQVQTTAEASSEVRAR